MKTLSIKLNRRQKRILKKASIRLTKIALFAILASITVFATIQLWNSQLIWIIPGVIITLVIINSLIDDYIVSTDAISIDVVFSIGRLKIRLWMEDMAWLMPITVLIGLVSTIIQFWSQITDFIVIFFPAIWLFIVGIKWIIISIVTLAILAFLVRVYMEKRKANILAQKELEAKIRQEKKVALAQEAYYKKWDNIEEKFLVYIKNIKAKKELVNWEKISKDFPFSKFNVLENIRTLVLFDAEPLFVLSEVKKQIKWHKETIKIFSKLTSQFFKESYSDEDLILLKNKLISFFDKITSLENEEYLGAKALRIQIKESMSQELLNALKD